MKATTPIGIQPGTKLLRIERVVEKEEQVVYEALYASEHVIQKEVRIIKQAWLIWIHHNPDFTLGTYLTLYPDGKITNTTVHEDGTETTFRVKGSDE